MKKALVLYSGGLDSRLVVRILQEQNFEITALYFNLPFGCGCCNTSCNFNFTQKEKVKMEIFDVTKEPLLSEYIDILKDPKFGTGSGINPCKDCKIFMFRKAKEYADKNNIEVIATGEVIGQRPMSQIPSAMKTIDEEIGFEILRPLCAKRLKETSFEEKGLVDRDKLLDISGRGRKPQIELAEKYDIKYPTPGGGCFLCEKEPSSRLRHLLKNNLITEKTLPLTMIGRHFFINKTWLVVARDAEESKLISEFTNSIKDDIGKPAIYISDKAQKEKALELQEAYSSGDNEDKRNKFLKFKL
jgi:tRNA-uridine 2-sulfurtransferase